MEPHKRRVSTLRASILHARKTIRSASRAFPLAHCFKLKPMLEPAQGDPLRGVAIDGLDGFCSWVWRCVSALASPENVAERKSAGTVNRKAKKLTGRSKCV
jgi:hypothetical protein